MNSIMFLQIRLIKPHFGENGNGSLAIEGIRQGIKGLQKLCWSDVFVEKLSLLLLLWQKLHHSFFILFSKFTQNLVDCLVVKYLLKMSNVGLLTLLRCHQVLCHLRNEVFAEQGLLGCWHRFFLLLWLHLLNLRLGFLFLYRFRFLLLLEVNYLVNFLYNFFSLHFFLQLG